MKRAAILSLIFVHTLFGDEVDYQRDVRPILSGICFKCHGPDNEARKGNLRLDLRDEALKPAKSGAIAIVPGDINKSELVKRILTADQDDLMPPPSAKHPLTDRQKQILKDWVAQGADYKPHWSFLPPKQAALPKVSDTTWPKNEIDHFILARLEKENLKPSTRADKYTLVRRLYLDLIGLPPTLEEADAFIDDTSAKAYENLVDRLLTSPHYGERWARRWLDLARYADTNGYEKDRPRSIWPYRDWVINALNRDMPFDKFAIEQIAGDMLPNATIDQIIATGFHRNSMFNEEGGADPLEYRFHAMVDRVHVTATTFLGMTMACAQCHTHKYDPISHNEYYSFMALLDNADEPIQEIVEPEIARRREGAEDQIKRLEVDLLDRFPVPDNIEWRIPGEAEFSDTGGADSEFLKDGSFRITGKNPDTNTYTIRFNASAQRVTHLQLEAIPDPHVHNGGPGRTDHGNFVVSEIDLKIGESNAVQFASAEADFSQDGFPVERAFDGKQDTGWAIATEKLRQHRHAIFKLTEPQELPEGAAVTIRISQQYDKRLTLGRFRLSLGSAKAIPGAVRRQELIERYFEKWLSVEAPKVVPWKQLQPVEANGDHPTLDMEADNVVFASGDFTKNDTYTIKFKDVPAGSRALRIEALPDPRLPNNGPGRAFYEGTPGDFLLTNLKATAGGQSLNFRSASHSFAAGADRSADKAIDDDLQSGWSANGGQGKRHSAVFQFAEPFAGGELTVVMTMERYFAAALGKFRISVTSAENAVASALDEEAYDILLAQKSPAGLARADREKILKAFAKAAPELAAARRQIEKVRNEMPNFPTTLVMRERDSKHARKTFRHHRGEFTDVKEEVQPGTPAFLPPISAERKDRLALARWLVSKDNPLTARVTINRQWEAFFGRGLVRTMEDFGLQGELPSHPELLDWLAVEFQKRGWSLKEIHKLIVMSATYQQSSRVTPQLLERDPNNIFLTRGPRFRVEAETVRDIALSASGLLSDKIGGPSVFPPQIPSITTEGTYGPLQWKVSEGPDRFRRSLYTFLKRTAPFAMTAAFDGPSGEACLARRDRSNTPLQSLTLLNDEIFMDCAKALGKWAASQEQETSDIVSQMFRRCLTRPATDSERAKLESFLNAQLSRFNETPSKDLAASPKEAAWTALARVILNLDEAITKS